MQPFTLTSLVTPSTLPVCPSSTDHSTITGTREFTRTTERTCSSFAAIPKLLVFAVSTSLSDLYQARQGLGHALTACVFRLKGAPATVNGPPVPIIRTSKCKKGAIARTLSSPPLSLVVFPSFPPSWALGLPSSFPCPVATRSHSIR